MNSATQLSSPMEKEIRTIHQLGFWSAILLVIFTVVTFGIAIFTPPIATITYPYTDIAARFPRDYYWMYPAILLMFIYIVFMVCVHQCACENRKIYSRIALIFCSISASILTVNYFIQVSVIQPSVINGEFEGIALLTQYNTHGIFIAAEEIGYLFMAVSILFLAPVFSKNERLHRAVRWTAILSFALTILALFIITLIYGVNRGFTFELAVISIDFFVLLLMGIFIGRIFRQAITAPKRAQID